MASLKELRTRISSVTSTRQMTSAMKLVSAAKLRKVQDTLLQLRPYVNRMRDVLLTVMYSVPEIWETCVYAEKREPKRVLCIVFTSNRGLCGSFNGNAVRKTNELIQSKYSQLYENGCVDLFVIGKKGADLLKSQGYKISNVDNNIIERLNYQHASQFTERLMEQFRNKTYDVIEIVYNQFKNAAVQEVTAEQFLPICIHEDGLDTEVLYKNPTMLFEPSIDEIVNDLIPKILTIDIYRTLMDSCTSEQGARMTAMHTATDNADELLDELRLTYNKERQAAITEELTEIESGANALS